MKNCSIIEDLDIESYQIILTKNHNDILSECFIRNFNLIRKYANQENQIFLTKFKKKIIPRFTQQLQEFCQFKISKNRQNYYAKRKQFFINLGFQRKHKPSLSQLDNKNKQSQQIDNLRNQNCILNKKDIYEPLMYQDEFNFFKKQSANSLIEEPLSTIIQNSARALKGPLVLISPKKRKTQVQQNSSPNERQTKIYASIYNDSIQFCKKYLFKTSLGQMCRTRKQRQQHEEQADFFNIRKTLADQKSLQRKMINVLKKRRQSRNKKLKILSKYTNSRKPSMDINQKQNIFLKKQRQYKKQYMQKKKMVQFGLTGKICLPMKHRVTASCILSPPSIYRENIQINKMKQKGNMNKQNLLNEINKINMVNSCKFLLPRFS